MLRRLSDPETNLEHMEQGGLAGVVEPKEKEFGMLVHQAQRSQDIPDYT